MPAVILACGCRVFIAEAHVERFCDGHERDYRDRYAVVDVLADQSRAEAKRKRVVLEGRLLPEGMTLDKLREKFPGSMWGSMWDFERHLYMGNLPYATGVVVE